MEDKDDASFDDDEWDDQPLHPVPEVMEEDEDDEDLSVASIRSGRRGRPRILAMWTKVISLEHDDLEKLRTYDLATDLKLASTVPPIPTGRRNKTWMPFFSPKYFVKDRKNLTTEEYKLTPGKLKSLGMQASRIRAG